MAATDWPALPPSDLQVPLSERRLPGECGFVITSYSIHYTKLYDDALNENDYVWAYFDENRILPVSDAR